MTRRAIQSILGDYAEAYCAKDIDSLMPIFDDTDNISVIGTGADELCVARAEVKELFWINFCEATANKFEWDWVFSWISENHTIISVTSPLHLEHMENQHKVPLRWTIVPRNEDDHWRWTHRHASTTASDQDGDQAYPKDNPN